MVQELKPLGEIAMTLCQDVAHELAKMQTLNAYERDQIYRAEHDGVSLMELSRRLDFPWAETHLEVLGTLHAQGVLRAQLLRAWRAASALVALESLMKRTRPIDATVSIRCARPGKVIRPSAASSAGTPIAQDGDHVWLAPYDDCVLVMPGMNHLKPGNTMARLGRYDPA